MTALVYIPHLDRFEHNTLNKSLTKLSLPVSLGVSASIEYLPFHDSNRLTSFCAVLFPSSRNQTRSGHLYFPRTQPILSGQLHTLLWETNKCVAVNNDDRRSIHNPLLNTHELEITGFSLDRQLECCPISVRLQLFCDRLCHVDLGWWPVTFVLLTPGKPFRWNNCQSAIIFKCHYGERQHA